MEASQTKDPAERGVSQGFIPPKAGPGTKNLAICIVGCGDRGRAHALAWQKVSGATIAAVADTDEASAQALAKETGAAPFSEWQRAIAHDRITVVSQCVPSCFHADVVCAAAERDCHVLSEKPLALTLEEGERIVDTVKRTGILFMPCFQYRDKWVYRELRDIFKSGELGRPAVFRASDVREVRPKTAMHSRSLNGGVVIDMACHYVDLFRWITEAEPEAVFAAGHVFGEGKEHLSGVDDLAIDEACIHVQYSGGHQLQLYLNWGMPKGFHAVGSDMLVGPDIMVRPSGHSLEIHRGDHRTESLKAPAGQADVGTERRALLLAQAIRSGTAPDITADDAMIALRVSYAALESIDSGTVVRL